jgi:hypothetical protein
VVIAGARERERDLAQWRPPGTPTGCVAAYSAGMLAEERRIALAALEAEPDEAVREAWRGYLLLLARETYRREGPAWRGPAGEHARRGLGSAVGGRRLRPSLPPVAEVRQRAIDTGAVERVLDEIGVEWADRGTRLGPRRRCRCPFPGHEDRTPSALAFLDEARLWCFGCNRGGDLFAVLMLTGRAQSFPEAMRLVAEAAGYRLAVAGGDWR